SPILLHPYPGLFVNLTQVNGVHPECRFHLEIHKEETRCIELLKNAKTSRKNKSEEKLKALDPSIYL
uniref:Uncharacterized protein n=1 Tax=Strix occidentalis caurina TaxID=311401 RepID=A0A8D0FI84_STROC